MSAYVSTKPLGNIKKTLYFFHPDYTVATGIAHGSCQLRLAGFTADWEFHPTLKFLSLL